MLMPNFQTIISISERTVLLGALHIVGGFRKVNFTSKPESVKGMNIPLFEYKRCVAIETQIHCDQIAALQNGS